MYTGLLSTVCLGLFVCAFTQSTLCPSGWTRYIYNCYKVMNHAALTNQDDALQICRDEHPDANLTNLKKAKINAFASALLLDAGAPNTFISLTDTAFEGVHLWADNELLNLTAWDPLDTQFVTESLDQANTELNDCVETNTTSHWNAVPCESGEPREYTLCQLYILAGEQCSLDGKKVEL